MIKKQFTRQRNRRISETNILHQSHLTHFLLFLLPSFSFLFFFPPPSCRAPTPFRGGGGGVPIMMPAFATARAAVLALGQLK